MILYAYTIYDNKALIYNSPFFQHNDAVAVRMFGELIADPSTSVGRHPGDYVLYCVGSYSDAHGRLDAVAPLRHVIDGSALVAAMAQPDLFSKDADHLMNAMGAK